MGAPSPGNGHGAVVAGAGRLRHGRRADPGAARPRQVHRGAGPRRIRNRRARRAPHRRVHQLPPRSRLRSCRGPRAPMERRSVGITGRVTECAFYAPPYAPGEGQRWWSDLRCLAGRPGARRHSRQAVERWRVGLAGRFSRRVRHQRSPPGPSGEPTLAGAHPGWAAGGRLRCRDDRRRPGARSPGPRAPGLRRAVDGHRLGVSWL